MSRIRVTVGIPTYNRVQELSFLMDSVLSQMRDRFQGQIEILVADDMSTDTTRAVVQEYADRYPDMISYRYNEKNLGYSRNVDSVICNAKGEFVLLMGDDDALEENALSTLWDILDSHDDLGVVILGETPYDPQLKAPLADPEKQLNKAGGVLYRPGLDYVRERRRFTPALISGCVLKRDAWLQSGASDFYDTISIHILCAMRILLTHALYFSNVPAIKYRTSGVGGDVWTKDSIYPFAFDLGYLVGCRGIQATYPAKLHRYLHRQAMRSIVYLIMRQKSTQGPIHVRLLRMRLQELADKRDPLTWLAFLLLRLPRWLIRILMVLSMKARHS
ncbi:MAG: glycosyltransferase family 2 protein [Lentisphaerae bacterium]|nr:glycosyltransferase family 2 protein [Lentisphaerota bacterium]